MDTYIRITKKNAGYIRSLVPAAPAEFSAGTDFFCLTVTVHFSGEARFFHCRDDGAVVRYLRIIFAVQPLCSKAHLRGLDTG